MTIQTAQQQLLSQLKMLYDEREAANITDWVMEHITGKKKTDRLLNKQQLITPDLLSKLDRISKELSAHRPVQYVLGEAWFAGIPFYVNEHTLIPRPETEELINWVIEEIQNSKFKIQNILDIGTGSGCIPVVLKKKCPEVSVMSVDVSKEALLVAAQNAQTSGADISLLNIDFLEETNWDSLPMVNIIVSNPPYIKQSERKYMTRHVLDFEPGMALFVSDEDALVFYRKISLFGMTHLTENGFIFLEINEALGKEVTDLFTMQGYLVELKKDLQGKDRMVKAVQKNSMKLSG